MFFFDIVIKFFKNININEYIITLIEDKQLPYRLIYTLCLIKLETLKICIKTYLKTTFI